MFDTEIPFLFIILINTIFFLLLSADDILIITHSQKIFKFKNILLKQVWFLPDSMAILYVQLWDDSGKFF